MTAANRNQPVAQHQHSRPARQILLGLFRLWQFRNLRGRQNSQRTLCETIYEGSR